MVRGDKIPVIVTGAGGGGIGEQCIGALQTAGGYRIVATDTKKESAGLAKIAAGRSDGGSATAGAKNAAASDKSRECDVAYIVPPVSDSSYAQKILKIAKAEGAMAIIPGSEPELEFMAKNRKVFTDAGLLVLANSHEVIRLCLDKLATAEFLRKNGFPYPKTQIAADGAKITVPLPAIIKPASGAGGSKNTFIAQTEEELEFFAAYARRQGGAPPLVQEYVGSFDEEYTAGVLTDFDGALLGSVALRRFTDNALSARTRLKSYDGKRMLGISTGISQGEIGDFPKVTAVCEKIALALHSSGPLNLQCRLTEKGPVVFEINPRFSGTTSIRALAGFNEPDALIRRHLLGEKVGRMSCKKCTVLRRLENVMVDSQNSARIKIA